jgi:hypothetical protein
VRTIDLQVTCATAYQVAMTITDNRRGTLTGTSANSWVEFGIGRNDDGTRQLGFYTITPATSSNTLPSGTVQVLRSSALSTWVANGNGWAKMNIASTPAAYKYISPGTGTTPVGVTSATIRLNVNLALEPLNTLRLTQVVPLDGSATIELVYL